MKKTIGIDCFKLEKGTGKSIGIYVFAERLVKNLATKANEYRIVVFGNEYNQSDFASDSIEFVQIQLNHRNKFICILWELYIVARYMKKYNIDEIILPRGFAPLIKQHKCMVVIHDMIPFYYNEHFKGVLNPYENFYIMNRLKASIVHAGKVVTISDYSKREILRILPQLEGDQIKVILHGFDYVKAGSNKKRSILSPYIFAITSMLPHKNAVGIVKSYESYYYRTTNPIQLVITGIESVDDLKILIDKNIKDKIVCKKYLADDEFYELFRHAECLLFLSLVEGYGWPPLESMQFGVPAIVSNRSSLPEIIGEAGILVNPEESEEVADKLLEVISNKSLRQELADKGIENLKRFNWDSQINLYIQYIGQDK